MSDPTRSRRRAWALLGRLLADHRQVLAGSVLGGIGWQAAGIVVPLVVGITVQRGIVEGDRAAIWWGGLALVGLGAFEAVCAALRHRMAGRAYVGGEADVRTALTDAALRLDTEDRDRFGAGQVVARATSDARQVAGLLDAVGHTVAQVLAVPVVVVVLVVIDPVLALVVGVTLPVTALIMWRYSVVWHRHSTAVQEEMGTAVGMAQETVEGFRVLRGLGAEGAVVGRFTAASDRLRARGTAVGRLWLVFEPVLDVLSVVAVAAVLFVGGNRVLDGSTDLGGVVTAVGFVLFLAEPVRSIGERILTVQVALAAAARIVEVLDAAPPLASDGRADPFPGRVELGLQAAGLTAGRPGSPLVAGVELTALPGELAVLDGATGSGKSTLLATLAGLRVPLTGRLALGGLDLLDWPPDPLHRRVHLVGPVPFLFGGTIAANLRFAAADAPDAELDDVLAVCRCGFVAELPDGVDTVLGERGVTLSGGQRQRLALARTLLARPTVLLLDGATSALDADTELAVVRGIRAHLPEAIVVAVTHHPGLHAEADQVLELRDRRLVVR